MFFSTGRGDRLHEVRGEARNRRRDLPDQRRLLPDPTAASRVRPGRKARRPRVGAEGKRRQQGNHRAVVRGQHHLRSAQRCGTLQEIFQVLIYFGSVINLH